MKGNLIKYVQKFGAIQSDHVGVIIDYKPGYHIRESWSAIDKEMIEEPMVRIYWFNSPSATPETAKYSLLEFWNLDEQVDLFEPKVIIEEWDELDDNWFLTSLFEIDEK
jgi:hypothetical protein